MHGRYSGNIQWRSHWSGWSLAGCDITEVILVAPLVEYVDYVRGNGLHIWSEHWCVAKAFKQSLMGLMHVNEHDVNVYSRVSRRAAAHAEV